MLCGLSTLEQYPPSQHLGLFIHYAMWAFHLGAIPVVTAISLFWCAHIQKSILLVFSPLPFCLALSLIILLLISCWKHHWFYTDLGQNNPYKTAYKILDFARKHKYPLHRSAFTYCDDYIPSRIDFAKERFGGPFTTEQVEDVKTFVRIVCVLFAVGPVLVLEVPASFFVFPLFSLHTLHYHKHFGTNFCKGEHIWETIIGSGTIMTILSTVILFPAHIWINFSVLHKRLPKVFTRLGVGIVVSLLGVASLLIIDMVGHSLNKTDIANHTQCMFQVIKVDSNNVTLSYPTLNMHWAVLLAPSFLLNIGPLLVTTTTLEFISAQSPQSMKGLLIGVFFAIRGIFQFLNSIIIIPFSLKHPWANGKMIENPPVTNCGFAYLLFTCMVGLIGFVLFSVAAKRYKYRKRNEGMFRQQDVEEIYDHYITQAAADTFSNDYSD